MTTKTLPVGYLAKKYKMHRDAVINALYGIDFSIQQLMKEHQAYTTMLESAHMTGIIIPYQFYLDNRNVINSNMVQVLKDFTNGNEDAFAYFIHLANQKERIGLGKLNTQIASENNPT